MWYLPVGADAQHVPAGVAGKGGVVALEHSDKGLAEEYDYFLLKADGPGRVLTTVEKDNYGAGFIPGDIVIEVRFAYWCCDNYCDRALISRRPTA